MVRDRRIHAVTHEMTPSVSAKFSVFLHARYTRSKSFQVGKDERAGSAAIAGSVVEARLSLSASFEGQQKYA